MKIDLGRKVKILTAYAVVNSLILGSFVVFSFLTKDKKLVFDELTAKRINVINNKGELRMVISNSERQHPGRMNGKDFAKRQRPAGIIFFNEEGDECGGLIYDGATKNGYTSSGMSFTMDQYHQDQVVQIFNQEDYDHGVKNIKRGVAINDYPVGTNLMENAERWYEIQKIKSDSLREQQIQQYKLKFGAKNRLFIGRDNQNRVGVFLSDIHGNVKIKIYVDENGNPKIQVIDNKNVVRDISVTSDTVKGKP